MEPAQAMSELQAAYDRFKESIIKADSRGDVAGDIHMLVNLKAAIVEAETRLKIKGEIK